MKPEGLRQDTRHRTKHCLRPTRELVEAYLATPAENRETAWTVFEGEYLKVLEKRFRENRTPFDKLAKLAHDADVYLGCSCPTQKNPDPSHCHTIPALRFMKRKYPRLHVQFPEGSNG